MAQAHIVTVTLNPTIDKSCSTDHVVPEQKLRCSQPKIEPGGGGLNVARALHQLGGKGLALWSCGGPLGEMLQGLLDQEQIAQLPISIEGMTRENLIVDDRASGQQYRFGMPGPELHDGEVERWLRTLSELDPVPDFLVASGSLPPGVPANFYARMIERLPVGCRVIVDTSGPALKYALEAGLYLAKPNLRELGQLAGSEINGDEELAAAARELIANHQAEVVVVSLGSGGAVLVTADTVRRFRAPTVPIRSKVGAGDSMVAGMALALARDYALADAVRFGVAAGAAAVMTRGTQLCRRSDTEQLYAQMAEEQASHEQRV